MAGGVNYDYDDAKINELIERFVSTFDGAERDRLAKLIGEKLDKCGKGQECRRALLAFRLPANRTRAAIEVSK